MLTELTVKDFLDKVSGSDPVPGGGSVSALCGALAAALGTMVTRLTIGKKGYEENNETLQQAQDITIRSMQELIELIDKDAEAYRQVFACFQLPKATDEEKATRSAAIQQATKHATLIPFEVAKKALIVMSFIVNIAKEGNRNAITDACVAMMTARTAILGALLNVRINLSSLKDKAFVDEMQRSADSLEESTHRIEKELLDAVNKDLRV